MNSKKLVIIGLGGIGSILSDNLCRYLNHQENKWTVTLIDGDSYELKNQERQTFVRLGNKARVKAIEFRMKFENIIFNECEDYITPTNIDSSIKEGDMVFVCVDNHKTRKLISEHIKKLRNVIIVSGGNEKTDGNIQITTKKEGKFLTANLIDYHPEIDNPKDKSPHEMSCEELSKSEPQLLFTNMTVATIMCWIFYSLDKELLELDDIGEVYFDILNMSVVAHNRIPKL